MQRFKPIQGRLGMATLARSITPALAQIISLGLNEFLLPFVVILCVLFFLFYAS